MVRYGKDEGIIVKFSPREFLYCTECKRPIDKVENMLFVEDHSLRGFCTDDCIVGFYTPLMESLDNDHLEKRAQLGIDLEDDLSYLAQNQELFEKTLYSPEVTFQEENDIGQKFFIHHRNFKLDVGEVTLILVCLCYEGEPSFVGLRIITQNPDLINLYKSGQAKSELSVSQELEQETHRETELKEASEVKLSEEILESVEFKKSQALAELIGLMTDEDFSLEEFHEYEAYLEMTLRLPDEIYSQKDNEEDELYTYIKSFKENEQTFFYVVICLKVAIDGDGEQEAFLPVLAFPSRVSDIYRYYAQGDVVKTNLKN